MKKILSFAAMALVASLAYSPTPARCCGIVGASSYGVSASFFPAVSVAYAQPFALVVPAAPVIQVAAYAPAALAVQAAAPCPAAVPVMPQAEAVAPAVIPATAFAAVQSYSLAEAVPFLTSTYGCSASQAFEFLRVRGFHEAVAFTGNPEVFVGRGVFGRGVRVNVGVGRRGIVRRRTVIRRRR